MPKPGHLTARWSKREADMIYAWGDGCSKSDGAVLHYAIGVERMTTDINASGGVRFDPSLRKELEARGYDIATLRFSIKKRGAA